MANPFTVQPLGGLQNIQMIGQGMQGIAQNVQADREEQRRQQLMQQAAEVMDRGNPREIAQFSMQNPEVGEALQQAFNFSNEQTKPIVMDTYQRALADPDNAVQIMQQGIDQVASAGGHPEKMTQDLMLLQQNPEAGLRNIEMGFAASAPDVYDRFFGRQPEPTAFMQEMQAAGIEPGSDQFKAAVLERYGKGKTIGYDVVEAVNPDTGRNEYFQVSRTDPGDRISLGIEVPVDPRVSAARAQAQSEQRAQAQKEMGTVTDMLDNVNQIIESPGLESWSGIQAIAPVIPGTEQANTDALVERLQSQQFLKNISAMKGMGALSNAEGQKVAAAASALKRSMTDDAVKKELNRIKTELEKARQRIQSGQLLPPEQDDSEPLDVNAAEGRTRADREANAAADASVINWEDL